MGRRIPAVILALACLAGWAAPAAAASRGIEVTPKAGPAAQPGGDQALVIGIDAYDGGWPRLKNAVRDARFVAEALRRRGFSVRLETDLAAAELKRVLEEFFVIAGEDPDARLVVWFAGHGHSAGGEAYLVPADAPRPEAGAAFRLKALSLRRFGEYVRLAEAGQALAVFDSCFSGTLFRTTSAPGGPGARVRTRLPVRQFITSGDAGQKVADDGTFRRLFLGALDGREPADADRDGLLTGSELGRFLSRRMSHLSGGRQTPRYGKLRDPAYDRGEFAFRLPGAAAPVAVLAPRPPEPDPRLVRRAQRDLAALGYRPGPRDGLLGRRTRAAIRAYQADAGLRVDGRLSETLLAHLRRSVAAAAEVAPPAGESYFLDARSRVPGVPTAQLPPPGYCRLWYSGRSPAHQPLPFRCGETSPSGSGVVYQREEPARHPPPAHGEPRGGKDLVGTLIGAAIGGLAGSRLGDGRGRLVATAAGTFIGALVGNRIGRTMDEVDRAKARRAYAAAGRAPLGQAIVWNNPRSGNRGSVTALREGTSHTGRTCREFRQTVVIGGRRQEAYGTACRQPDGSWQLAGR